MEEVRIIFKENSESAINYKTGVVKEKSAVVAEIKRKKMDEEIVDFKINELGRNKEFIIKDNKGNLYKIEVNKKEYYAIVLETVLKRKKKKYDKVVCVITGGELEKEEERIKSISPWEAIVSSSKEPKKIVNSPIEVFKFIDCMYKNDEIKEFNKKGKNTISYEIITIDDEMIEVITSANNDAAQVLEMLYNKFKEDKKRKIIVDVLGKLVPYISVGTVILIGALVVTNPYVNQKVKLVKGKISTEFDKIIENSNRKEEIQNNLLIMSAYNIRLKSGNLTNDEYDHFVELLVDTIKYYEENENTDSVDYEILLDYKELIDSEYQPIRRAM